MLVFVDTNVWFPVSVADLILRSVEAGLFELAWSDESMAELERILVDVKGLTSEMAQVFIEQIKATAPTGRVDSNSYNHLVNQMTGRDPGDYVLSSAVRGGKVEVLLTENLIDFPQKDVGSNVKVLKPDQFFSELLEDFPLEFVALIKEMSANLKKPLMSGIEVLGRLEKSGLSEFAKQMRELFV